MNKYLIKIKSNNGASECITINGDSLRPFQIANNLWNYQYPGHAARKLSTLAKSLESNGLIVTKIYGTISDMPRKGNDYNIQLILAEHGNRNVFEIVKKVLRKEERKNEKN